MIISFIRCLESGMGIDNVTARGVTKALVEHDRLGEEEFLRRYGFGRAKTHFVRVDGKAYSSKAVLGVGHKYSGAGWVPLRSDDFHGGEQTLTCLRKLGFTEFTSDPNEAEAYVEGERQRRETLFFTRNPKLVRAAKSHHGVMCQACGFDFAAIYGSWSDGYIECHHLEPLAERDGVAGNTSVSEVAVLCSNCHRMVHRRRPALSLEELKTLIESTRRP
jgi:hypothetical protein